MRKSPVSTCIIPAAGRGSRWAPVSGYLPKEMLPLIDKPVIEWVIEQAVDSGCKSIVVVINKHKDLIRKYLEKKQKVTQKVKLSFVYQEEPLGIAHALYLSQNLTKNQPFAVVLPDLPTISKVPVLKQLIKVYDRLENKSHIVSFDKFSLETTHLYGECLIRSQKGELLKIVHFCPGNPDPTTPHHFGNTIRMSGSFIFNQEIFPIIEKKLTEKTEREISDRTALKAALESGQKVVGVRVSGHTYDTGYPTGYVRANTAFFKKYLSHKIDHL